MIGQVVMATHGRDKGRYFVVCGELEAPYVLISDGATRRLGAPKKKKIKHLALLPDVLEELRERFIAGEKVSNAEIRRALAPYGQEN